jgi:hypothetical protein
VSNHAFPCPTPDGWVSGMSLRDYFAAKAMQGMCANPDLNAALFDKKPDEVRKSYAKSAYALADDMLAARGA